jgi:hypothetical protein
MKHFFFLITLFTALSVQAQRQVELKEVLNHVRDTVKQCGKVFSSIHFTTAPSEPTSLNLAVAYLNQLLAIVIWLRQRDALKEPSTIPAVKQAYCKKISNLSKSKQTCLWRSA